MKHFFIFNYLRIPLFTTVLPKFRGRTSHAYNAAGSVRVSLIRRLCNCETCGMCGTPGAQEPLTRLNLLLHSSPFENDCE